MRVIIALLVLVLAPNVAKAKEQVRPLLRTSLEQQSAIPGQPIILNVTVLVPTWMPKPPVFPSFETPNVIVRLPPRASGPVSERVGGETWSGISRRYRLYPMTVGRFRISPQSVSVTFADPETREPRAVTLRSEELTFEGVAPKNARDLDPFIAAEDLTLEQVVEGDPENLKPGGAFTRMVTARIKGSSSIFLPPMLDAEVEGLSAYPKEPVIIEKLERGTVSGERVESVTYVTQASGRFTAPSVHLLWFNLRQERIETAKIEGIEVLSRGPAPDVTRSFDWRRVLPAVGFTLLILGAAAALVLRFRPAVVAWFHRRREAYQASEAFAFAQALAAIRARNLGETLRTVDLWCGRLPAGSMGPDARLSRALAGLGAAYYRGGADLPTPQAWSEADQALRGQRRDCLSAPAHVAGVLPLLNPGSS